MSATLGAMMTESGIHASSRASACAWRAVTVALEISAAVSSTPIWRMLPEAARWKSPTAFMSAVRMAKPTQSVNPGLRRRAS